MRKASQVLQFFAEQTDFLPQLRLRNWVLSVIVSSRSSTNRIFRLSLFFSSLKVSPFSLTVCCVTKKSDDALIYDHALVMMALSTRAGDALN